MIVVADTSPLNYLVLIGHVEVLPYFYQRVLIPPSVWAELQDAGTPDPVRAWAAQPLHWLERHALRAPPDSSLNFLDRGEREAMALALEVGVDRLIADETLVREEAKRKISTAKMRLVGTIASPED